mgnify:CR=1 FL=1
MPEKRSREAQMQQRDAGREKMPEIAGDSIGRGNLPAFFHSLTDTPDLCPNLLF